MIISSFGKLTGKKTEVEFEDLSDYQSKETAMQPEFGLIRGGGNGGSITITAIALMITGTPNSIRGSNELLVNSRFYVE